MVDAETAFPVAAATLWHRLPYNIRDSYSIDIFHSKLKNSYFLLLLSCNLFWNFS